MAAGGCGIAPTQPEPDKTPPVVVTLSPVNGSQSADVNTNIVVGFSERIDRRSVTGTSFRVDGVTGTLRVDGSVVTLDPDSLQLETPYTVVLTTDIRDLVGNRLAAPMTWSFRTRARVMANAGQDTRRHPSSRPSSSSSR